MLYKPTQAGIPARIFNPAVIFLVLLSATWTFRSMPAQATTVTGRTVGSFAVSPTGAATYTIPIWAPPGPKGIQPQIALTYNSQQGNGYLGVGWSLSGLSSIYRCNLTFAQDAAPAPVALVISDGYCMDGQRLRLTSTNNYGMDGSTYQTEIANFMNVTAHGSAGNGPAYWTAQDRNGRTYTYGAGGAATNAQVLASGTSTAIAWELNEVSDPSANTMMVAYNMTTGASPCISSGNLPVGSAVPCTISWTPSSHGSSSYNYTMNFVYGANVAPPKGYIAGTPIKNPNLLSSITISHLGSTVKDYVLSYQASTPTGRDLLTTVKECSDSGATNCMLPTSISYQSTTIGVSTSAKTALSGSVGAVYAHHDLNGDGYSDLVYSNGTNWYVVFGSQSGYGTGVNTGITASTAILIGDLLGKGQEGILAKNGTTWYYYTWNGSSFAGTSTGLAYDTSAQQYVLADINGDGLPDLVKLIWNSSAFTVYAYLNTGAGSSVSFGPAQQTYNSVIAGQLGGCAIQSVNIAANSDQANTLGTLKYFDFNGDGRQDVLLTAVVQAFNNGATCTSPYVYKQSAFELISVSTSTTAAFSPNTLLGAGPTGFNFVPLNWNSDNCTDIYVANLVEIAGCNGSAASSLAVSGTVIGAMDWNGDGQTDLLVASGGGIFWYQSTGDGIGSLTSTGIGYSSSTTYFAFDADGDGMDDLGYVTSTGTVGYYVHNNAGQPPDLMTSVSDGYGNSASPTYVSTVRGNYTPTTHRTYPYQSYSGPIYVVSEAVLSDPSSASGGTYNQTFSYVGAWTHLQGRGFTGFEEVHSLDSRNSLWTNLFYDVIFPYVGILDAYDLTQDQARTKHVRFNWIDRVSTTLDSTQYNERYFVYFDNVTFNDYEVSSNSPENAQLITTSSTNYTYDNYGNPTSIATTLTDDDPNSPYLNQTWTTTTTNTPDVDTAHWCLSLFTETQVAYSSSLSGSNSVTRTKTFTTPDTINCRYNEIVTEPSSSQVKVTEDLTYDNFGNVATDKVTGVGMTPRQTTLNWGMTGQFINTATDPSGAQSTWTYTSAQSLGFGVPDSVQDANNLLTQWSYDGFGRKVKEIRPDSTSTTWSWSTCTSHCGWANSEYEITQTTYQTNGSTVVRSDTTLYDPIDRVTQTSGPAVTGGNVVVQNAYNSIYSQGVLTFQQSLPFFSGGTAYQQTYSLDFLGRVTTVQRPISSTNSNLQTTTYSYAGRTTTITDANGSAKTLITDVNGWLRQTKDAKGYAITLAYDAAGGKTSVSDNQGNTLWSTTAPAYAYGITPMLLNFTDADLGNWSANYDALGEMTGWKDAKGQNFTAAYDALSRMTDRFEPDLYTHWTWGSSPGAHEIGQLHSVCTGTGANPTTCTSATGYAENETYDSFARPYQRAIQIPSDMTYTYARTYNSKTGLLDTLTYPATPAGYQLKLQFAYSSGLLQTITDATTHVALWTGNTVDGQGHFTQETMGNGVVVSSTFDSVTGWLNRRTAGVGGGSALQNNSYLFDYVGNLTQRQDNNTGGVTENVYPDVLNRLDHTVGDTNTNMTYDTMGRLSTWAANGSSNNVLDYTTQQAGCTYYGNAQPHALRHNTQSSWNTSICYDANGNMARVGFGQQTLTWVSYAWTSYNQPIQIAPDFAPNQSSSFSYDHNRQRWLQVANYGSSTETTEYIGGLLEKMTNSSGTAYRYYVPAGNNLIVYNRWNTGSTPIYYITKDHLGSSAIVSDSSGASLVKEKFSALGWNENTSTEQATIASVTRHEYTGQEDLDNVGMVNMNGRIYGGGVLPALFLSPDPYIPDPTDTRSYNRYAYVNYNPLTYIDPSGFCPPPVTSSGSGLDQTLPMLVVEATGPCWMDFPPGVVPFEGEYCALDPANCPQSPLQLAYGGGSLQTITVAATRIQKPQENQTPCANASGSGVLVQLAFTDAHSSGGSRVPGGANHTFVLAVDPTTGAVYASRGGPGSGPGGNPGIGPMTIVAVSGPYNNKFPDYGSVTGVQTIGYVNAPFAQVTSYMNAYRDAINARGLPYLGPSNNSNSYAGELLMGLGFWPLPWPAMSAPGFGQDYKPIPNFTCTAP